MSLGQPRPVTLVTYNVQNLFDATDDGNEYHQYTSAGGWNSDAYYKRLVRLGRVLGEFVRPRPDIIALQEVEGPAVVSDLLRDYLRGRYSVAISPTSAASIRVAVVSRHPIRSYRIHRSQAVALLPASYPVAPVEIWRGREMVDAEIDLRRDSRSLRIIACHWKSQSGGERQTEPQRLQSAALLRTLLSGAETRNLTVIMGDLNEDVDEYLQHNGTYPTALMPHAPPPGFPADPRRSITLVPDPDLAAWNRASGRFALYSPWLESESRGSYYHGGSWERLDQVLMLPDPSTRMEAVVRVVREPELTADDGRPLRYDSRTGRGFSDHLPVVVDLTFSRTE